MKKHCTSFLALLLAAIMLFSLAACTNTDNPDEPTPTDAPITETPVDDGKWIGPGLNGDESIRLPNYELTDHQVDFLCHYEITYPEITDISYGRDIYNLTWSTNVVGAADRVTKLVALVMGGNPPEIFQYDYFAPSFISKGYVQAWNDYIDFDIALWKEQKENLDMLAFKDKYYYLGSSFARWENTTFYNKELFEEYGVRDPMEYYKEGNWTWDTFRELALTMHQDVDADGIAEVYDSAIEQENFFVYTTGLEMVTYNAADGTATNNLRSPELARAIQYTTDLRNAGCVYDGSDGVKMFTNGKVAILATAFWAKVYMYDMLDRGAVGILPPPRDPSADKYYIYQNVGAWYLLKDCDNPLGAAAYACADRYQSLDNEAREAEKLKAAEVDHWSVEMQDLYDELFNGDDKTPVLSTWVSFGLGDYWGDFWFRPLLGEPWSKVAEELYPLVDEKIDSALNG